MLPSLVASSGAWQFAGAVFGAVITATGAIVAAAINYRASTKVVRSPAQAYTYRPRSRALSIVVSIGTAIAAVVTLLLLWRSGYPRTVFESISDKNGVQNFLNDYNEDVRQAGTHRDYSVFSKYMILPLDSFFGKNRASATFIGNQIWDNRATTYDAPYVVKICSRSGDQLVVLASVAAYKNGTRTQTVINQYNLTRVSNMGEEFRMTREIIGDPSGVCSKVPG